MVLILFLNDFLTMSISTDRMEFSRQPNRWNTRGILLAATVLAVFKLVFSLGVFLYGHYVLLLLDPRPLQTLTFATLIFSSQAGVYILRERGHFWQSRPGRFLVGSSVLGLGVTALLTLGGIFMPAISPSILLATVTVGVVYFAWPRLAEDLAFRMVDSTVIRLFVPSLTRRKTLAPQAESTRQGSDRRIARQDRRYKTFW